ncbi:MAG: DNA polymerase III subunit gamma/tau [Ruminococcus sp.]|nr:DNA polymerase III subunit gamma/tau [Ruminococcus sp.]
MYQVLYRKYRPQTFCDVVGQHAVVETLKNELKKGRIHHAYLFTGSRGTGKTTCAKILSKAVNCLSPVDGCDPCCECESCKGIDSGEIFDVVEMDAASNRGIDDIRSIIDEVGFTPAKVKYRVYIIDEVHMLTTDAWNALLKTLEEPPKHVIFILATTEVHKIPATILSRCQRFDFHHIKPADIAQRLKYICEQEGVTLTDEAATLISVIADGALRDAISLLDRCIGISSEVDAEIVRSAAGLASKKYLFEICNCVINKNPAAALEMIDGLYKESKNMTRLCDELISHFRSLMLIKTVKNPKDMLVLSEKEFEAAYAQADYLSLADIIFDIDVLARAYERMGKALSERAELEMAVVKLCAPELDRTDEALFQRVTALEKAVKMLSAGNVPPQAAVVLQEEPKEAEPKPAVKEEKKAEAPAVEEPVAKEEIPQPVEPVREEAKPEPEKAEPIVAIPPTAPAAASSPPDMDVLYANAKPFTEWKEVIKSLRDYAKPIAEAFSDSSAYISGDYLLIASDREFAFSLLKVQSQRENVKRAVREITGKTYRLGPYRKPKTEEKKDDVLDTFIHKLRDMGVSVTEE